MSLEELRKALKEKTITFGTEKTLKLLRNGKVKKVFVSSNCSAPVKDTVKHYAKMNNVEVVQLELPNDEIGLACKKHFSISVFCY